MFNVKIIQKVTTISQTFRIRQKSYEIVEMNWHFHRHSTLPDITNAKIESSAIACDRTCKEPGPWILTQRKFLRNHHTKTQKQFGKGKPTKVVSEYLPHFQRLQHPTFEQPTSFNDFSNFLSTKMDAFKHFCFHLDLHSTANVEHVLKKLPITNGFEWKCHALAAKVDCTTLSHKTEWLGKYAKVCGDLRNITIEAKKERSPTSSQSKVGTFEKN